MVGLASNFIVGDELIPLEKHTEIPLIESIDPACVFLGNRPALWPLQENRQYAGVVEPQLSWQRYFRLPEMLVKALHCCMRECTQSHDVWKAVSWWVDKSTQVDKFLHCANLLLLGEGKKNKLADEMYVRPSGSDSLHDMWPFLQFQAYVHYCLTVWFLEFTKVMSGRAHG